MVGWWTTGWWKHRNIYAFIHFSSYVYLWHQYMCQTLLGSRVRAMNDQEERKACFKWLKYYVVIMLLTTLQFSLLLTVLHVPTYCHEMYPCPPWKELHWFWFWSYDFFWTMACEWTWYTACLSSFKCHKFLLLS